VARTTGLCWAGGGPPRRLTDTSGPAGLPAFSPDGRAIAYLARPGLNTFGGNSRVYRIPVEGGPAVCLTEKFDRSFAALWTPPAWSGDGRSITVAAEDRGALALYRVSAMGAPAPAPVVAAERFLRGFSVSRDGRWLAFTASAPVSPPEVFLATADGGGERRLTRLNDDWRGQVRLSAPEHFEYERDGVAIDGWVMKPFGWTPGHKYPALLNIHGGPHTQYGFGFFDEFQV